MALAKDLMQVGIPDQAAIRVGFQTGTITGGGALPADANVIPATATLVSVTGGTLNSGIKLPASAELGVPYVIAHLGANNILIYPPTGGQINGDTATTGTALLLSRSAAMCMRIDSVNWAVISGAAS